MIRSRRDGPARSTCWLRLRISIKSDIWEGRVCSALLWLEYEYLFDNSKVSCPPLLPAGFLDHPRFHRESIFRPSLTGRIDLAILYLAAEIPCWVHLALEYVQSSISGALTSDDRNSSLSACRLPNGLVPKKLVVVGINNCEGFPKDIISFWYTCMLFSLRLNIFSIWPRAKKNF